MPIRLQEKLRESRESIVGLDNIIEIIACSNAEVEPYYECMSCGTQGEANGMYNHLEHQCNIHGWHKDWDHIC